MITAQGESIRFLVYKRKENSSYEWEDAPSLSFLGRMANDIERKEYRIQKGVNGGKESVFILSSNLPSDIIVGDRVDFMQKQWVVGSVGFYYTQSRVINYKVMDENKMMKKCPKGITLE